MIVALQRFNEQGYVNTTMRDIAALAKLSTGNLAYHFKNKDVIIELLYQQLISERHLLLSGVQQIPSFENINRQIGPLMDLYFKYRFFYLDILEITRAHPIIAQKHRQHIQEQTDYIKAMLIYAVGTGHLKVEEYNGTYSRLSHTIWMVLAFWLTQEEIRKENSAADTDEARQRMWMLVAPYLTENGKLLFEEILSKRVLEIKTKVNQ